MILEIIGLPGVGKTFIASRLSSERHLKILTFGSARKVKVLATCFVLKNPSLSFWLIVQTWKCSTSWKLFRHKAGFLLAEAMAHEEMAQKAGSGIVDEGLIGFVASSLYEEIVTPLQMRTAIERIAHSLPPRSIVAVEASTQVRNERMHRRGRVPRSVFGDIYQREWLKRTEENFTVAMLEIGEKYSMEITLNS